MDTPTANVGKILLAFACLAAYIVILAIYRLFFSPLAIFPGPKVAGIYQSLGIVQQTSLAKSFTAITSLYQFYFDVIRGGEYIWQVEEMHKRYGESFRMR